MVWIRHDSHEQTVIKNGQALGTESPLETDEDGYAEVEDDEAAALLAASDAHVTLNPARDEDSEDEGDEDSQSFDAAEFVDRTPMEDVIEDIESGDYDEHLDAIKDAAERQGVEDAVDDRRE